MSHRYVKKRKSHFTYTIHKDGKSKKVTQSFKPDPTGIQLAGISNDVDQKGENTANDDQFVDVAVVPVLEENARGLATLEEAPACGQKKMNIDLIVKFGGSAVTVKDQLETIKECELNHGCAFIKFCQDQGKRVIVVHGAGSFGHQHARKYNVNGGFKHLTDEDKNQVKYGFCATRISVTKLNHLIVERLFKTGVHAVGISALGSWSTDNREVTQHNTDSVLEVVNNGLVPVLHGDCVLDQTKGCVILSGDVIIKTMCKFLNIERVVFLTDVDGIYNKPPNDPDAEFIPEIYVNHEGAVTNDVKTAVKSEFDVTGGIDLKLKTAKEIVLHSNGKITVWICNVMCKSSDILNMVKGTIITLLKIKK